MLAHQTATEVQWHVGCTSDESRVAEAAVIRGSNTTDRNQSEAVTAARGRRGQLMQAGVELGRYKVRKRFTACTLDG